MLGALDKKMGGDIVKNPPRFSMTKNYEMYKKELESWKAITSVEEAKLGRVIALSLPEDCSSGIRQKVFNSVNLDGNDGYKNLIEFFGTKPLLFQ